MKLLTDFQRQEAKLKKSFLSKLYKEREALDATIQAIENGNKKSNPKKGWTPERRAKFKKTWEAKRKSARKTPSAS